MHIYALTYFTYDYADQYEGTILTDANPQQFKKTMEKAIPDADKCEIGTIISYAIEALRAAGFKAEKANINVYNTSVHSFDEEPDKPDLVNRQEIIGIIEPRLASACPGSLEHQRLNSILRSIENL